jgi:N-acetylglucosamine malate deacetylase 1
VPHLTKNPIFFYYHDRFEKPNPFDPDVVVNVDSVMDKKLDALGVMVSQFYEGGANGSPALVPSEPEKQKARHQQVRDNFSRRNQSIAEKFRAKLGDWTSDPAKVKHAEAFEVCEYGSQPDAAHLKKLFPFSEK